MSYKVTTPDGKTAVYEDINKAVAASPAGSKIVNTKTGVVYTVKK